MVMETGSKVVSMNEEQVRILDLLERGFSPPQISKEIGKSPPTIRQRIAQMQADQGLILQYRELQNLKVTELQHWVLEAITPEKIQDAPLQVLVQAYKILKEKELLMTGKPTEIKGLVGYLIDLEKHETHLSNVQKADVIEPEFTVEKEDLVPNLF